MRLSSFVSIADAASKKVNEELYRFGEETVS